MMCLPHFYSYLYNGGETQTIPRSRTYTVNPVPGREQCKTLHFIEVKKLQQAYNNNSKLRLLDL